MAEGWLRNLAADALQCAPAELMRRGLLVASAGLSALPGERVSEEAFAVMEEKRIDLSAHLTRPLTSRMVEAASVIYAMTATHRDRLLRLFRSAEGKTYLLSPAGEDIPDPFGAGTEQNREARDEIRAALEARLPEILALLRT